MGGTRAVCLLQLARATRTLVSEPLVGARMSGDSEDRGEEDEENLLMVGEEGEEDPFTTTRTTY